MAAKPDCSSGRYCSNSARPRLDATECGRWRELSEDIFNSAIARRRHRRGTMFLHEAFNSAATSLWSASE